MTAYKGTFSVDTAWPTAGNWTPSGPPASTDEVFINSVPGFNVAGSDQSLIDLDELNFGSQFTNGLIGTSGSPLLIDSTLLRFSANGGKAYLDGIYPSVIFDARNGLMNEACLQLDGTITDLFIENMGSGWLTLTGGGACTNIWMLGCSSSAKLVVDTGITGLTRIEHDAGTLDLSSACATVRSRGGNLIHRVGAITTLELAGTSRCKHLASATITTLLGSGPNAEFDGRENPNLRSVTVTNATIFRGFRLLTGAGGRQYVFTNGVKNHGGFWDGASGDTMNVS